MSVAEIFTSNVLFVVVVMVGAVTVIGGARTTFAGCFDFDWAWVANGTNAIKAENNVAK